MKKRLKNFFKLNVGKKNKIRKELMLGMLNANNFCIAYNKNQNTEIWNYMLSEDKSNLFVYDGNDITIYDGLVKDAPDYIFKYGEIFSVVSYEDLNLIDGIVSRKNFNLLNNKNTYRKEKKYLCGQK